MASAVELEKTPSVIECTDRSFIGHDVIESALTTCLAALAELASAAGQAERALRLRNAAAMLSAVAVAMGEPGPPSSSARPGLSIALRSPHLCPVASGGTTRYPLTARELEVVQLIIQGLTNRQVAEQLVISERTADAHMQNILNKLGLTSRAQVAAWFVEFVGKIPLADRMSYQRQLTPLREERKD